MNFQMFKEVLAKAEEPEIKLPTAIGSLKKWKSSRKTSTSAYFIYFILFYLFIYAKAFDCVDHSKLWKILQEIGMPDYLTCLLRNLYESQEAALRTGHGAMGSELGKEYVKYIYCDCLFSLYAEYIMLNAGLDEVQAGIKTAGRNINNLRYADDTTLIAESNK